MPLGGCCCGNVPSIQCLNGLNVEIGPGGNVEVFAADAIASSSVGSSMCGPAEFAICKRLPVECSVWPGTPSVTFDCSELGAQPVRLWIRDAGGNTAFCDTSVIVQDNGGFCGV